MMMIIMILIGIMIGIPRLTIMYDGDNGNDVHWNHLSPRKNGDHVENCLVFHGF